jgi:CopG family transcriptional regulator/antitoxin EndoAI
MSKPMSKRINITLPDKTLAVLDRVATKGDRSKFISRAVLHFIESQGREALRERLKREAIANASRDVEMAAEWFRLKEESSVTAAAAAKNSSKGRKTVRPGKIA